MATQLENLIIALDAKTSKFNSDMKKAASVQKSSTDKMISQLQKVDSKQKKAAKSSTQFRLSTLAQGITIALVTKRILKYADAYTNLSNRLRVATSATGNLEETTEKLFGVAEETRTSITATVDLYAKMERATRGLDINQTSLLKITSSVNKAFAISGATTAETTGAIRQLGQALAAGALRGDEFNSIAENAPLIMEAVKEATGKTAGELRELAATGAITAEVLIESLERYADTIDGDFALANETFGQSLVKAQNNAIKFVGENEKINEIIKTVGQGVIFLSENLNILGEVATAAAAIFASRFIIALTATNFGLALTAINASRAAAGVITFGAASRVALLSLGPLVAIAALATAAIFLFVDSEDSAEEALRKTNKRLSEQRTAFKKLDPAARAAALKKITTELDETNKTARSLERQIAALSKEIKSNKDPWQELLKKSGELKKLEDQLEGLEDKSRELNAQTVRLGVIDKDETKKEESGAKDLIDLDERARKKAEEKALERAAKTAAANRERELQRIRDRQADFEAESETEITALQKRLDTENDLIDEAEAAKQLTRAEAIEARIALENEFLARLEELGETAEERLIEKIDLELALQEQLLAKKIINEEQFQDNVLRINRRGTEEKIKLAQKEAKAKSGLDNLTLKFGLEALDTFSQRSKTAAKASFAIKKIQKGSEAIVSTAAGVTEALPNIPLAVAVGLAGAAQVATIASQTFEGGAGGATSPISASSDSSDAGDPSVTKDLEVAETVLDENGLNTTTRQLEFTAESGDQIGEMMARLINDAVKNGKTVGGI